MSTKLDRRSLLTLGALSPLAAATGSVSAQVESRAPARPFLLRFAVASDGHYGQPDTAYYRFHQEMIIWLNDEAAGKGLDFVVLNGDLIHDLPDYLREVKYHFDGLQVPYFVCKGNHDMSSDQSWEQVWGMGVRHDVEKEGYAFLFATTSNEKGEYLCVDTTWLKHQLEKHRDKLGIFAFFHISQHAFTMHGISCPEVTGLLEAAPNLVSVFHGHDHDQDNVIYSNRRAYLFDGHMGGSWGTNYRGYRIVEIDREGRVRSYQCNPAALVENRQELVRK